MSKFFFASDLHGDLSATDAILRRFEAEGAERLVLLGDLLYHGPRNDLPKAYAPKEVISRLNTYRDVILAVRGNCDTEVDQMVLDFPILADYALLHTDGFSMFLTHGHHFSVTAPPPLREGDCLVSGHTHVAGIVPFGNSQLYLNPGSPSIPKENTVPSYLIYESRRFSLRDLSGKEYVCKQW
jgi:putative phosphoesterase